MVLAVLNTSTADARRRELWHTIAIRAAVRASRRAARRDAARRDYGQAERLSWRLVRAHLCTLAVAVALPATWRAPRAAYSTGGLQYGLAVTAALLGVALPLALLQLAVGQLSQQDAVGAWSAVPFFKGVGYLRLLASFLSSTYCIIYIAFTIIYFLYTISNNLPFWECIDKINIIMVLEEYPVSPANNMSSCLNETFLGPVTIRPEYYLAITLIVVTYWIILPFIFYNPVKYMRRLLYVLGPSVIIIGLIIVSSIGVWSNLSTFAKADDWGIFREPEIWHQAIVQALIASQTAGGYLFSAGDAIYSSNNARWTAVGLIAGNIVSTWASLLFWCAVGGEHKEPGVFAVFVQILYIGANSDTDRAWSIVLFFYLFLSGFITILTLLFPVYDRCRRMGGVRWRVVSVCASVVGIAGSVTVLAVRQPALSLLEDVVVPLLVCLTTVLEIFAFVFIYGWKVLLEDIAFLTGHDLCKLWVVGWCAASAIIVAFTAWWASSLVLRGEEWTEPPWTVPTVITTSSVAILVVLVVAAVVVVQQVHYDCTQKLKSSFCPARHWGPRDPIRFYYWTGRKELNQTNAPGMRRVLGQFSGQGSTCHLFATREINTIQCEKTV